MPDTAIEEINLEENNPKIIMTSKMKLIMRNFLMGNTQILNW